MDKQLKQIMRDFESNPDIWWDMEDAGAPRLQELSDPDQRVIACTFLRALRHEFGRVGRTGPDNMVAEIRLSGVTIKIAASYEGQ